MERIVRAAGLESHQAREYDIRGETVVMVDIAGDAHQMRRSVRAALPGHYPVLAGDSSQITYEGYHHELAPTEILNRAATLDFDAALARSPAWRNRDPESYGDGSEGYHLDRYDVRTDGPPDALVIVPRPEPWAAFAFLHPYAWGHPPELLVAAARRWHERYGAEPTVIGIACGFEVSRPPTDLADAERLAEEHVELAGLTAGTTIRAYARALLELRQWRLYDRP